MKGQTSRASRSARQDRGLTTARERHCFYQLVETWATRYETTSVLEGPIDGMDGISGVHAAGLARRGVAVSSFVQTAADAATARAVYEASGGAAHASVGVASPLRLDDLPVSDMVLSYDALGHVADWEAYVRLLAKRARKVLVVALSNPTNWSLAAMRFAGQLGLQALEPSVTWSKEALAPVLWDVGRVREHVYFDCSWWPDPPAPGFGMARAVRDRVRRLLPTNRRREGRGHGTGAFAYGPERWPYFGGPGWFDELLPALPPEPSVHARAGKLVPRLARMQAFVVDVRARTPQARRRLTQAGA